MKKDVLINIRGVYNYDGDDEPDIVEIFTTGTYQQENGHYYISYDESEATGFEGSTTTLKVEDGMVTMSRISEEIDSQLIIQDGVRHQCQYDLGYGDMMIGVNGHSIKSSLGLAGGDLRFRYSLDVNSMFASENELYITVKERADQ